MLATTEFVDTKESFVYATRRGCCRDDSRRKQGRRGSLGACSNESEMSFPLFFSYICVSKRVLTRSGMKLSFLLLLLGSGILTIRFEAVLDRSLQF